MTCEHDHACGPDCDCQRTDYRLNYAALRSYARSLGITRPVTFKRVRGRGYLGRTRTGYLKSAQRGEAPYFHQVFMCLEALPAKKACETIRHELQHCLIAERVGYAGAGHPTRSDAHFYQSDAYLQDPEEIEAREAESEWMDVGHCLTPIRKGA